jgi:hypothetical protein
LPVEPWLHPVTDPMEIVKTGTVAVLVPLAVFSANWIHRSQMGYAQTAAADLILTIVIFDIAVVVASEEFEPFIRAQSLLPMIRYWHFSAGFASGLVWAGIIRWGEPVVARYYETKLTYRKSEFPLAVFLVCWMAVLALIAIHVGFFAINLGGGHD